MKTIYKILIFIYTALLPLLVHGNHEETKNLLDQMARKNLKVNKVFQPSVNGFLGQGVTGLIYKGVMNGMEVAMKFISSEFQNQAVNEINTYIDLGAWNNPGIEAYGIPTLYYHGTWKHYYILAITLLDLEFEQARKAGQLTPIDKMIAFREMVRISKFIHSRGYCHGDLHLGNMMFRNNKAFIIDYNLAVNLRNNYEAANTYAKKDWKKFLADVAYTCGIAIEYSNSQTNPTKKFKKVKPDELRKVLAACAETIYEDQSLEYNHMFNFINEQISKVNEHGTAMMSWISSADSLHAALSAMSLNEEPSIESIEFQTYF